MNRNQKNWLKAIGLTIGVLGGMGLFVVGLAMFYFNYPQYFVHTFVIILGGMAFFGVVRLVKDGFDDEDASDKYWEETYPAYSKTKKKRKHTKSLWKGWVMLGKEILVKNNKMIKWFKSRWSMKPTGKSFYDSIGGDVVHYWIDCYGVEWMAVSKWGFRVETK